MKSAIIVKRVHMHTSFLHSTAGDDHRSALSFGFYLHLHGTRPLCRLHVALKICLLHTYSRYAVMSCLIARRRYPPVQYAKTAVKRITYPARLHLHQQTLPKQKHCCTFSFSAYALPSSRRGSTSHVMTVADGSPLWSALITANRGSVASSGLTLR